MFPHSTSRRTPRVGTHRSIGRTTPRLLTLLVAGALLLSVAVLVLSGCAGDQAPEATATTDVPVITEIAPGQLAEMLKSKDFLLINTHVPYAGEIEQTDLFIDYEQAAEKISELPADKNAKIVVYCQSDRMSTIAAKVWAQAGYTNLYNLTGGFLAWEDAGYELLQKPQ